MTPERLARAHEKPGRKPVSPDRVAAWVSLVEQIDRAQSIYLREADTSRAMTAVSRELLVSYRRARRLVAAAKLRLRKEATHTSITETKHFLRATLMLVISEGLKRQKAVVIPGTKDTPGTVEMVDDPDLRAVNEASKALAVLEAVTDGPAPSSGKLTPEQAQEAAQAALRKHYFGDAAPAALPSKTEAIDAHGESVREGEKT